MGRNPPTLLAIFVSALCGAAAASLVIAAIPLAMTSPIKLEVVITGATSLFFVVAPISLLATSTFGLLIGQRLRKSGATTRVAYALNGAVAGAALAASICALLIFS